MATSGVMLLTMPGLVDSATPALLFGGGLGLIFTAALFFFFAKKMGKHDGHDFMSTIGLLLGIAGVAGVYFGLFGN